MDQVFYGDKLTDIEVAMNLLRLMDVRDDQFDLERAQRFSNGMTTSSNTAVSVTPRTRSATPWAFPCQPSTRTAAPRRILSASPRTGPAR